MVRYDAFLKFLILLSPFSILSIQILRDFINPSLVILLLLFYFLLLRNSFMFLDVYGFIASCFFFSPLDASVLLITVVLFIVYLMFSCFISVSTKFFLPLCFLLCLPCLGFSHTLYIRKRNHFWHKTHKMLQNKLLLTILEEKQISEKMALVWMYHQQVSNYGTNYKE